MNGVFQQIPLFHHTSKRRFRWLSRKDKFHVLHCYGWQRYTVQIAPMRKFKNKRHLIATKKQLQHIRCGGLEQLQKAVCFDFPTLYLMSCSTFGKPSGRKPRCTEITPSLNCFHASRCRLAGVYSGPNSWPITKPGVVWTTCMHFFVKWDGVSTCHSFNPMLNHRHVTMCQHKRLLQLSGQLRIT